MSKLRCVSRIIPYPFPHVISKADFAFVREWHFLLLELT
jgi:hypothetical protein